MIRLDMTEYMEKHTVSRLIGSPPGYVGYDDGGQLTEKVRRKPWSVVLFDEIEKAHEDVWSILLQIMDDGRLTDARGHRVDFRNTIVVMTSNAGARAMTEGGRLGFEYRDGDESRQNDVREKVMAELKQTFRPEFLNRIDETVIFRRLSRADIGKIADRMLAISSGRLEGLGYGLDVSPEARELGRGSGLGRKIRGAAAAPGHTDQYRGSGGGAHPLRRLESGGHHPCRRFRRKNSFDAGRGWRNIMSASTHTEMRT
jgi:ATP-dependent Clp protease ATP-binding subunit ClpC